MAPITIQIDPQDYFQEGKKKISEGIKCLQDLIKGCKKNLSPENVGILHKTMAYFQSLQGQIKEIESAAHQGGAAPASFNVHGTDLQLGQVIESLAPQEDAFVSNPHVNEQQEITQKREQNVNFKLIPNPEINMGMNKKRKLRSDVWNYFTKYENKDKKVKAQCQNCKRDFDGLSTLGTTHLRNHLKSCLKIQNRVTDKRKELSVVDQELYDSDSMQKIINRLSNIKGDVLEVYEEEKNKLCKYLDKLPGRFNVTIGCEINDKFVEFVKIWFIDDKWKLKTRIIHLENHYSDEKYLNEDSLKRLIQDWNIDKRILSLIDDRDDPSEDMISQVTDWLNERVSLPVIGNYERHRHLLFDFESKVENVAWKSDIIISEVWKLKDYYMTSSNKDDFDLAVKQVESMGKKVTSKYDDIRYLSGFKLLDWAMGYKEVFCELKRRYPDLTSSNFDWDDATSLHSFWVVVEDIKNDFWKETTANERFRMVYDIFSKVLQLKNTENQYFRPAEIRCSCREIFAEYCNNIVTVIPVILDPRFKLEIVEHFYNEVYDNEGDLHFKKMMDDVTNVYNEYAKDVNNSSMVRANANEAASSKSEFERYLTADKVPPPHEGFDILEWWHVNSSTYPTLAMMARDFLSIPILGDFDALCILDGFADIYRMGFYVGLKDALTCTKVWLNDHDCM